MMMQSVKGILISSSIKEMERRKREMRNQRKFKERKNKMWMTEMMMMGMKMMISHLKGCFWDGMRWWTNLSTKENTLRDLSRSSDPLIFFFVTLERKRRWKSSGRIIFMMMMTTRIVMLERVEEQDAVCVTWKYKKNCLLFFSGHERLTQACENVSCVWSAKGNEGKGKRITRHEKTMIMGYYGLYGKTSSWCLWWSSWRRSW